MNKAEHKTGKGFFAAHAKSSAFIISVIVHAIILIVAVSFVAVTVYVKKDIEKFEGKKVKKPRLALRQLKVPVKAQKKKPPKPKLTKRLVVNVKRNMQDFKMPEVTGIKAGMGSVTDSGLGGVSDIGFSMPEIELFGVKSKGEKVFIILDASNEMMRDEMGGIEAYTLIKDELTRILNTLPPTTLFNIAVHDGSNTRMLFPDMSVATGSNLGKVEKWLKPLNSVKPNMGEGDWGCDTLGSGGVDVYADFTAGKVKEQIRWYQALMTAMKQQADSIFVLNGEWGNQRHLVKGRNGDWDNTSAGKRWNKAYQEGLKLLEEENKKRAAAGKPPRVLSKNPWAINAAYFPGVEKPPDPEWYDYTSRDFTEAMLEIRKKNKKESLDLQRKSKKMDFSVNVIQFRPSDGGTWFDDRTEKNFSALAKLCDGEFRTMSGLQAIQSYVSSQGINLDEPATP